MVDFTAANDPALVNGGLQRHRPGRVRYDGNETLVELGLVEGAALDLVIRLSGHIPLTANDFGLSVV